MAKSLYYLFFAVILFTSCKDEDDTVPQSFLNGTYEIAGENTDTGIWYVSQYIFHADGTYEYLQILRETEDGDDLGYWGYLKGSYTLRGEDLVLKMTESFALNQEEFPDGYAESLEDLETQAMSADFVESKGTLKRLDSGGKISLLFECNDMLSGYYSMCMGELVYHRVD